MTAKQEQCRIIVAGMEHEEIACLMPFARVLAQARGEPKSALGLVSVARSESLSSGAHAAQQLRRSLESLLQLRGSRVLVRVTHDPWQEIKAVAGSENCSLLIVSWGGPLANQVLRDPPCEVVVVNGMYPQRLERILLPIRGGPYAALSLQIALAFAQAHRSEITLLHAAPPVQSRNVLFREFFEHLQSLPEITRRVELRGDALPVIMEHARPEEHQLLIMGSISRPQPGTPVIGPTAAHILDHAQVPALIVKTRRKLLESSAAEPQPVSPVDYTISVVVDKWFAENTFHAHEFEDLKRLVAKKEHQGLTISLGLPALNEQDTIGRVIKTVRQAFMERYPLLDEIVVIDSNSTDNTVAIARDLGVPVVRHAEILPQYGVFQGKGEALWTSLYALQGDLIAWIDTDIVNIHPRFVYGILGPLIQEPRLMYVKGFYQRPLRVGKKLQAQGGGRVTELVARPMLNLFYPELSGMIQPLSGEYAGRREALESVPFFTGYGVEIGLLVDLLTKFGLKAIGQVDLEERVHRNQSLLQLSKMAFAIIQVLMERIGDGGKLQILNAMNASLKLIRNERDEYRVEVFEIRDQERPPMITVPEYRALRSKLTPGAPPVPDLNPALRDQAAAG